MTLSEIIAKDSLYDSRIPLEGVWKIYTVIQNGKIILQEVTEQKKKKI